MVNVAVNVCRRTHIRVSKPVLNHLHRYFVGKEQGRAGMSQIVEADFLQSVFRKNDFEMRTDILWRKNIPDSVHADVVEIFFCSAAIIGGVIGGLSLNQFWLTLIGFTAVCFLVSSCNSVITSIFPLFMKKRVNAGFIAGILNGCCYLGSTISSYGFGDDCRQLQLDNGILGVFCVQSGLCGRDNLLFHQKNNSQGR